MTHLQLENKIQSLRNALRINDFNAALVIYNELDEEIDWNLFPDHLFEEFDGLVQDSEIVN